MPGVTALSLHLIPLEPGRHKIEVFAANRTAHPNWRTPDMDTADGRIWAFAGAVPHDGQDRAESGDCNRYHQWRAAVPRGMAFVRMRRFHF